MLLETTYGINKRLIYCKQVIQDNQPKFVLDYGCGTGANLTYPLAQMFPHINLLGLDSDERSISFANDNNYLSNIRYENTADYSGVDKFDLIIFSEVLEHVEEPGAFLVTLSRMLSETGIIMLTTPNGYGPFELLSFVESIYWISGVRWILKKIKKILKKQEMEGFTKQPDTLAVSPHINFFNYRKVIGLFEDAGLKVIGYSSRTFLCGFLIDDILSVLPSLIEWNASVANRLPKSLISAWMFILKPLDSGAVIKPGKYRRNGYELFRRYLNEKRWGLR